MSKLDDEINDLLTALRLKPRNAWPGENCIPIVAGRCAGSYGCGGPIRNQLSIQNETSEPSFLHDLSELLNVGVAIEHATAALARKYGDDKRYSRSLSALLKVMRNPESSKEDFAKAMIAVFKAGPTKFDTAELENLKKAIAEGQLDRLK